MVDFAIEGLKYVWPWVVTAVVFVWSFVTSRFAWWVSGCIANIFLRKSLFKRIVVAVVLWLVIIGFRLYVFFRLLFKGVMPWTQAHAWNTFLKLVECFVEGKMDTGFMAFVTFSLHAYKEGELEDKDIDMSDVGPDKKCGRIISPTAIRFLKILYQTNASDQKYLSSLLALVSKKDNNKIIGKVVNKVMDELRAVDLNEAKKNYIKIGRLLCDKIVVFATEKKDSEIAYRAVRLHHLLSDFEWYYECKPKVAVKMVDEIATALNSVCGSIYVYCKLNGMKNNETEKQPLIAVTTVSPCGNGEDKSVVESGDTNSHGGRQNANTLRTDSGVVAPDV